MSYHEEMAKGFADAETVAGESFGYDGTEGFLGYFGDDDPEMVFMTTGVKTSQALILDATKAQFAAKSITPAKGKRITYGGKSYVIRVVFPVGTSLWRFRIYLP